LQEFRRGPQEFLFSWFFEPRNLGFDEVLPAPLWWQLGRVGFFGFYDCFLAKAAPHFSPERGCVVLDQPQPHGKSDLLRLVFDTAALRHAVGFPIWRWKMRIKGVAGGNSCFLDCYSRKLSVFQGKTGWR